MGHAGPISELALLLYSGRVSAAHCVWAAPWSLGRVGYVEIPPQPVLLLLLIHVRTAWGRQVALPALLPPPRRGLGVAAWQVPAAVPMAIGWLRVFEG